MQVLLVQIAASSSWRFIADGYPKSVVLSLTVCLNVQFGAKIALNEEEL